MRNNIASVYSLPTTGVTADHNLTLADPTGSFAAFDRTTFEYDLHPTAGSAEIGYGTTLLAPAYDLTGAARAAPITAGAYQDP